MSKVLEVIVTSVAEAIEAEAGGADRLELIRSFEEGGLTPDVELVSKVTKAVSIPVRVMVRETSSMTIVGDDELRKLKSNARDFSQFPIDGLVVGWVRNSDIDVVAVREVLSSAPHTHATFHRAIEHTFDPGKTIQTLKQFPQIDRVLTSGGAGSWADRKRRLLEWRKLGAPEIEILVGGDLTRQMVAEIIADPGFPEVHVGRAVRIPHEYSGAIDRSQIALLKNASHL
jgi:copper homeostasis protein